MGKNKLHKFAEMEALPNVFQCPMRDISDDNEVVRMAGHWRDSYFHNDRPIVLELGCGHGDYTVGLARLNPDRNFIGIDIKGARMWQGAKQAYTERLANVAFLRINIEWLMRFFAPEEVDEIWITFPDPQMKKATKRLTSTFFMERYRHFLLDDGIIHLKTDSPFMFTYTKLMVEKNQLPLEAYTEDLYKLSAGSNSCGELPDFLIEIQTYYEQMWMEQGLTIKYLRFRLPHGAILEEPDVEIPVDGYRSYQHEVRSTKKTGK